MCKTCAGGRSPKGIYLNRNIHTQYVLNHYIYCFCDIGIKMKEARQLEKLLINRDIGLGTVSSPNYHLVLPHPGMDI